MVLRRARGYERLDRAGQIGERQLPLPGRVRAVNRLQLERRPITGGYVNYGPGGPKGQRERGSGSRKKTSIKAP